MKRHLAALAALCIISTPALAISNDDHNLSAKSLVIQCQTLMYKIESESYSVKPKELPTLQSCIDANSKIAREENQALAKKVKSAAVRAALKEHLIVTLTALKAVQPQPREYMDSYRERMGRAIERMDEAWVRVEAEL